MGDLSCCAWQRRLSWASCRVHVAGDRPERGKKWHQSVGCYANRACGLNKCLLRCIASGALSNCRHAVTDAVLCATRTPACSNCSGARCVYRPPDWQLYNCTEVACDRNAMQCIELRIKICQSSYFDNKAGLECCAGLARPTGRTIANPQLARLRAARLPLDHGSRAVLCDLAGGAGHHPSPTCRLGRCCASCSSCSNHSTSCCAMRHHSSPAFRGLCFATDLARCFLLGLDAMLRAQLGCGLCLCRAVRLDL